MPRLPPAYGGAKAAGSYGGADTGASDSGESEEKQLSEAAEAVDVTIRWSVSLQGMMCQHVDFLLGLRELFSY